MVVNRMSCVLFPTDYDKIWRVMTPISCFIILVLPCGGMWNIWISKVIPRTFRGGFTIDYIKTVKWAALSLFQSIFIVTALIFTIICTLATLLKLILLPDRIKHAEKSLCFTSIFISLTFILVAATQLPFAFCASCDRNLLYMLQSVAFDIYTVGPAVIIVMTSKQIREQLFFIRSSKKRVSITVVSSRWNTI
ncbi:unnamed protein product [Caenorhabditis nigoni]